MTQIKIIHHFYHNYSFDFKLLGSVILKKNENKWLTAFSFNSSIYKDFKKDYLNKVNAIKNFLEKCNVKDSNIRKNFYSHDYKVYIYNS